MSNKPRVLITGAGGFVGQALTQLLLKKGYGVRALVRNRIIGFSHAGLEQIKHLDLNLSSQAMLKTLFDQIDIVIHLAAHVHQVAPCEQDKQLYYDINLNLTSRLAEIALETSVQQFIYLSTIKVNGEKTEKNKPFTDLDQPNPQDDYAKSKYLAELSLKKILSESTLPYTIIRPPLVYGPTVGGNFQELTRLVKKNSFFLWPLGGIENQRSLIQVDYLAQCIECAIFNSQVYNKVLLVADQKDRSTPELIQYIANLHHQKIKLWDIPPILLSWVAKLIGAEKKFQKLTHNLQIDSTKSRALLRLSKV